MTGSFAQILSAMLFPAGSEGVVYLPYLSGERTPHMNPDAQTIIAFGGGAASPLWLQIQADIFHKSVRACTVKEQACLGACILAAVGTGIFTSLEEGCDRFVTMNDQVYEPNKDNFGVYEERYRTFRLLYQQTWNLMQGEKEDE